MKRIPKFPGSWVRPLALTAALSGSVWAAPIATTITLKASSATITNVPGKRSQPVQLTATVLASGQPITGQGLVRFCVTGAKLCQGSTLIGQAQLTASGATIHPILSIGTHSITAVFAGTTRYAASSSAPQSITFNGGHTQTTLNPVQTGNTWSLTASVSNTSGTPVSGNVTFVDVFTKTLGTVALGANARSLSFSGFAFNTNGSEPLAIASGDFNGDGFSETAVANLNSNTLEIAAGTNILTQINLPGGGPMGIAVADFNSDGNLDIAVAQSTTSDVAIYLGHGDLTFTYAGSFASGGNDPVALVAGDFNNDGIPDLAVSNLNPGMVLFLRGSGNGNFTFAGQVATDSFPYALVAADFNHDGNLDVATANYFGFDVSVLVGNGQFGFQQSSLPNTDVYPDGLTVDDFNGDGKLDLAVSNEFSNDVTILLGNGDGTFNNAAVSPLAGKEPSSIVSADFNLDGIPDLAVPAHGDNSLTILLGKGDGTFAMFASYSTGNGTTPHAVTLGDLAGEGLPDLAVAESGTNNVVTYLDTPTLTATATLPNLTFANGNHLLVANYLGSTEYLASSSPKTMIAIPPFATTMLFSASATSSAVGTPITFNSLTTPATNLQYSSTGTVNFYANNVLIGSMPINNGTATLQKAFSQAGTYTVSATYTGNGTFLGTTSAPLTITITSH